MLRIELAVGGRYDTDNFERELRRRLLVLLSDIGCKYPSVEINRVQFIKPNKP